MLWPGIIQFVTQFTRVGREGKGREGEGMEEKGGRGREQGDTSWMGEYLVRIKRYAPSIPTLIVKNYVFSDNLLY